MKNRTCFILGSGRSLLNLTEADKSYINNAEFVLAFNKYLIFSDLVGIRPTHYLLGDDGIKADVMLRETVAICKQRGYEDLTFILGRAYQPNTTDFIKRKRRLKRQMSPHKRLFFPFFDRKDTAALSYAGRNAIYIDRHYWLEGGDWARALNETIFHFRGSLSGAINLANIFHPTYDVKLLGVDLDHHAYFFQEAIDADPGKWGVFLQRLTTHSENHETIVDYKGVGGIQEKFPFMVEQVARTGGRLLCCNPSSYLVEHGIVPFAPIIPEDQTGTGTSA